MHCSGLPILAIILTTSLTSLSVFAKEIHVSKSGDDKNDGSPTAPYKTISAAAAVAQPGDTITVHEGVYRERVNPPRGGESDSKRIVYQAALGEKVTITGAEEIKNWEYVKGDVWKVVLPNSFFGDFNPYGDLIRGDWFNPKERPHHTGAVYLDGNWLIEAAKLDEVMAPRGTVPSWLGSADPEYLLNVARWRPLDESKDTPWVEASKYTEKSGTQNAPCSEGGECIGFIQRGHWVKYKDVDFGAGAKSIEIRAASASRGGTIEIHADRPEGELLGSCAVPNTGDWQSWSSFKTTIKPVSGVKTICLVFRGAVQPNLSNTPLWFAEVDDKNTTIWAQFINVGPNSHNVEINVRQTVFYPENTGINYITLRGFNLCKAATNWAPPTAEQIGIVGTNWSKGWIIESNTVSHSVCSGIALGKHGDEFDNTSADTAEGYVKTIERAIQRGWSGDNIGHHTVRNNTIYACEQTGIVGSLGAVFSTITGNSIHDIHVRQLFTGAEMAGIKLHAAIDVEIRGNHISRTCRGIWLDWMNQGSRVTGNLFHDNISEDLFVEVDHGPFMVDNNVFLSPTTLLSLSQGGAYVHNLIGGAIHIIAYDARMTPYHKAHSTEIAGMHDNPCGDDRWYNNVFIQRADMTPYDTAKLPVWMSGNVYLKGAKPSKHEVEALALPDVDPGVQLVDKDDGTYLEFAVDPAWSSGKGCQVVNSELLGKAAISGAPYEQRDGSPFRLTEDFFGKERTTPTPTPGPFSISGGDEFSVKVW
ncbi:MAG: carbohydrate-binding protein [Candidatus Hydrogenedentes bacterium]|nr:carbohydrate-binding protein [Candidatus Hydrogenedentota bacterium]